MNSFTVAHLFGLLVLTIIILKIVGAALFWFLSFVLGNKLTALLREKPPVAPPYRPRPAAPSALRGRGRRASMLPRPSPSPSPDE